MHRLTMLTYFQLYPWVVVYKICTRKIWSHASLLIIIRIVCPELFTMTANLLPTDVLPRTIQIPWGPITLNHLPLDEMAAILADDNFKCIFLYENYRIPIRISLKFVSRSPIDNKPALVQVMAWRRTGDKPLPEPILARFTDTYIRH